jgi:hypothetical protein
LALLFKEGVPMPGIFDSLSKTITGRLEFKKNKVLKTFSFGIKFKESLNGCM